MRNLKLMGTMFAAALCCSLEAKAECAADQYLVNGVCTACPAYATCDKVDAKCRTGYVRTVRSGAVTCTDSSEPTTPTTPTCTSSQYLVNNTCTACPANATCNGTAATCNSGYSGAISGGALTCTATSTGSSTCTSAQYLDGSTCRTCPANATCNGSTATCKSGYSKKTTNGIITCTATSQCLKQGSHVSIAFIKKYYQNCNYCWTENVAAGKCSKNSQAHVHYYCMCGGVCTGTSSSVAQQSSTASSSSTKSSSSSSSKKSSGSSSKSSSSCSKQGSHTSIDWIKKRYSNCVNCGTQKGSKGEKVYYCYCGSGCKGSSSSSSSSKSKSSSSSESAKSSSKSSLEKDAKSIGKSAKTGAVIGAVSGAAAGPVGVAFGAAAGSVVGAAVKVGEKAKKEVKRVLHKIF